MTDMTIAENVRRLRYERGLTQQEVAEACGLSRAGYRNVETGKSIPRADTLAAIARALDVPVRELVTPVQRLERVRFRSFKSLKTRAQILARVSRWLDDFRALEERLDDRQPYRLMDLLGDSIGEPKGLAGRVRDALNLGPSEPIRDICGLLESHGIKVLPIKIASDAFFGLSVAPDNGGPAIVVNTWERISVERWIFTAAHELGHLLLHLSEYHVGEQDEGEQQEKEANVFASHLLMPDDAFRREWQDARGLPLVRRVLKVKRMFRVSYRTVLYRLAERSDDPSQVWKLFQVQYRLRHGRTLLREDEPEALAADAFRASAPETLRADEPDNLSPSDFQEDRLHRLSRQAVEEGVISLSRAAEILELSLRDMRQLANAWAS
jgi:Zn-dependent peptidase ImmA (M78 family)/DNA-binding XRE family transcriptional regulator